MKFTLEQLRQTKAGQTPANQLLIAQAIKKHGPHAYIHALGPVGDPQSQPDQASGALVRKLSPHEEGQDRVGVCVTIVRFGHSKMDEDNLIAGAKPLRDAIAKSLELDDADERIIWLYRQVIGGGRCGTLVKADAILI